MLNVQKTIEKLIQVMSAMIAVVSKKQEAIIAATIPATTEGMIFIEVPCFKNEIAIC
jgi:hypothetical protein